MYSRTNNSPLLSRSKQGGFILLASLLVVSLLTLLVVATAVISQIELQSQYNATRQEMARQNALFGLNQALNQLQIAAGPDRRVTARADILNQNQNPAPTLVGYSADEPAGDSGQSFWTGVWLNTSNDYSGCAGNGLIVAPSTISASPGQKPGPGGTFLYYDYLPDGTKNSTLATQILGPTTVPSRSQLYYNSNTSKAPSNVVWLISWPYQYAASTNAYPDPTQSFNFSYVIPTKNSSITLSGNNLSNPTNPACVALINNLNTETNQNYSTIKSGGGNNSVFAPKVPVLENEPGSSTAQMAVGAYAYWVSDEGIKAKADIPDPYLSANPTSSYPQSQAHFQISQSPAVSQVLTQFGSTFNFNDSLAIDDRETPFISPTLPSMSYSDPSSSWADFGTHPSTYSPDFTVSSYGVIADSFNGGLREDLTGALEDNLAYQQQFGDAANPFYETARKVYSVNAILLGSTVYPPPVVPDDSGGTALAAGSWQTQQSFVLDGLRWDSLFYFYNIYHNTMPSPIKTATGVAPTGVGATAFANEASGGTVPKLPVRIYREPDVVHTTSGLDIDGIFPLFASYSAILYLGLNNTSGNNYDLLAGANGTVVEYNPFDVNFQKSATGYEVLFGNDGRNPLFAFNQSPKIAITGATPATLSSGFELIFNLQTAPDPTPFYPGELRVYSLSQTSQVPFVAGDVISSNIPPNFVKFSNTPLTSVSPSDGFYQYEEFAADSFTIPNPSTAQFTITGGAQLDSFQPAYYANNYAAWPLAGAGTGKNTFTLGETTNGSDSGVAYFGTTTSGGALTQSVTGVTGPGNLVKVAKIVCSIPGLNCPTLLAPNQSLFPNASGVYPTAAQVSLPFLAAGGCYFNPLATDANGTIQDHYGSYIAGPTPPDSALDLQGISNTVNGSPVYDTSWLPDSVGKEPGFTQPVLYTLPRQPLLSMGQFKGMYCRYCGVVDQNTPYTRYLNANQGNGVLCFSTYTLGGSYQSGLPTNFAWVEPKPPSWEISTVLLDDNFLANEVLFDGYFLSTVPPAGVSDAGCWAINTSQFNHQSYIDQNQPLPNSRLIYYRRTLNPNPPSTNTNSPNILDLQCQNSSLTPNFRKPAANLLINGAFNINSTSVPAWTALLCSSSAGSSISNNNLNLFIAKAAASTCTVSAQTFSSTQTPFLNFTHAFGTGITAWTGNVPFFGIVQVPTSSVENLAANIVAQVKQRGPFLSLGDFLNHRLTTASDTNATTLSNSGALQAAIDTLGFNSTVEAQSFSNSAVNIGNSTSTATFTNVQATFNNNNTPVVPTPNNILPPAPSNSATGVPGTLTQSDILQVIAPVIATRSDTFTIRFYGQALSPAGISEAEAYGEAVVQRLPEYLYSKEDNTLDNTGSANYAYDDPNVNPKNTGLTAANCAFGRRFKIVSFRWLNKNEL